MIFSVDQFRTGVLFSYINKLIDKIAVIYIFQEQLCLPFF